MRLTVIMTLFLLDPFQFQLPLFRFTSLPLCLLFQEHFFLLALRQVKLERDFSKWFTTDFTIDL